MCFLPVLVLRFFANIYFKGLLFRSNEEEVIHNTGFLSINHIHSLIRALYQGMYFVVVFQNIWVYKTDVENCLRRQVFNFSMFHYCLILMFSI